jgi:hypothetical protein
MASKSKTICNGNFYIVDETTVNASIAQCSSGTFKYHHSVSSLKYHMQAKHPFIAVDDDNHSQSVQAEDSASSVICLFVVFCLFINLFV